MIALLLFAIGKGALLTSRLLTLLLVAEVALLNLVIALNGAASNPFNAVLLAPVVLAFLLLPMRTAVVVLIFSILAQAAQLLGLAQHELTGHGATENSMHGHFQAMIISFMITSTLVAVTIAYLRRRLHAQEQAMQALREQQLRDEQLLAIGTAAAQLTHDLATPVQTARLLLDELMEKETKEASPARQANQATDELNQQLSRIEQRLHEWRQVADDIRANKLYPIKIQGIYQELQTLINMTYPELSIRWQAAQQGFDHQLEADPTLLPALTSIIVNACEGAKANQSNRIEVSSSVTHSTWSLVIHNAVSQTQAGRLRSLGRRLIESEHGNGVGAVVSNATLERFGGSVTWSLAGTELATQVQLPCQPATKPKVEKVEKVEKNKTITRTN